MKMDVINTTKATYRKSWVQSGYNIVELANMAQQSATDHVEEAKPEKESTRSIRQTSWIPWPKFF